MTVGAKFEAQCAKCNVDQKVGTGEGPPISPIVVNLPGKQLRFTGPENPVSFDIDADGIQQFLSWTEPTSGVAFLALDRNNNGIIDDGSELFGNFTDQLPSEEPNGYEALKLLDSNGDSQISGYDQVYKDLLLWTDRNHNGVSETAELAPLSEEVSSLQLEYRSARRRDRHGNVLRFWSSAKLNDDTLVQTVDVFFVAADGN